MNRTQLSQLAVLATVAHHGSFRKAAAELGIAPSAVSHAIASLEESLNLRLMARTTRSAAPTAEGRQLLETLQPALSDIASAIEALSDSSGRPAGGLRITMPMLAAQSLIAPRLGAFAAAYPEIELEIVTNDRFEDIVEKGYDAGLRLGEHLDADMIAVRMSGPWRGSVVGSPEYFSRHPVPKEPRDVTEHACIRRRFQSGTIYRWEFEKDRRALSINVRGPLILSDQGLMRQAAIDGAGLAYLFDTGVEADIREGRLIRVLDDWCPPFDGFSLYYSSRRQMRPALRAFIDFFRWRG